MKLDKEEIFTVISILQDTLKKDILTSQDFSNTCSTICKLQHQLKHLEDKK